MDKANFPVEFNNEIDDVKKNENEYSVDHEKAWTWFNWLLPRRPNHHVQVHP